ncbi:hypothetical protein PROPHIGD52-1_77 [Mycobacterium phage prophi52-1]|nr:hypothetical protein PROPHIGD52-1_77 [Mycobacterium phage prophi52-1]
MNPADWVSAAFARLPLYALRLQPLRAELRSTV